MTQRLDVDLSKVETRPQDSLNESRGKIDILFEELETLTDKLNVKTREFEERLEALKTESG